jgi:hypothetical protein
MVKGGPISPRVIGRRTAVLLLSVLSVSGCTWPARSRIGPSHVRPLPLAVEADGSLRIRYLRSALDSAGAEPVRVLVVHGMRTRETGYSDTLQFGIARRLKLVARPFEKPVELERGYQVQLTAGANPQNTVPLPLSEIRRRAWYDPATGQDRLVMYELRWSPTRDAVKDHYFGCFESGPRKEATCPEPAATRNPDRKWALNRRLKDDLMVDGFGDATVVLGPTGELLRDDVDLAFCWIASEVLGEKGLLVERSQPGIRCDLGRQIRRTERGRANTELARVHLFGITHSLGSFLVMDAHQRYFLARALARARADTAGTGADCPPLGASTVLGQPVADDLDEVRADALFHLLDDVTVYMRANQVALLNLARLQPDCFGFPGEDERGARCPNRALPTVHCSASAVGGHGQFSDYVAFNDVNDLLGFELPPYLAETEPFGKLVNVSVGNEHRNLSLPSLLKNPGDVHTSSDRNPAVLDAIVNGLPNPAPGNLPRPLPAPRHRQ